MSLPFSPVPLGYEQQLLVAQIGDEPDGILMRWVGVVWDRYGYLATTWPQLQRLYTQRDLLQIVWGRFRGSTSFSIAAAGGGGGSTSVSLSDKVRNLTGMMQSTQTEIERLEALWRGSQGPAVGQLNQVEPIPPPWPGMLSADSPLLSGSPYRTFRTWDGMPPDNSNSGPGVPGMFVPSETNVIDTNDGW